MMKIIDDDDEMVIMMMMVLMVMTMQLKRMKMMIGKKDFHEED